jgi:hypothetical protein
MLTGIQVPKQGLPISKSRKIKGKQSDTRGIRLYEFWPQSKKELDGHPKLVIPDQDRKSGSKVRVAIHFPAG